MVSSNSNYTPYTYYQVILLLKKLTNKNKNKNKEFSNYQKHKIPYIRMKGNMRRY